jgi:hypothetical protein
VGRKIEAGILKVSLLEKSLIVLLIFTAVLAFYFFTQSRRDGDTEELNPLDSGLISWFALLFVFVIFCAFIYFGENKYTVPENIGQIGDFIGGLTNPVLSFLALIVLLRTTSIQTREARKTTVFMEKQQALLEKEKFENTFFQLLSQLESYCESHFRIMTSGVSEGEALSRKIRSKSAELNKLDVAEQVSKVKKHIDVVTGTTECTILYNRAMRVVRFIDRSELPSGFKRSYASILRDTIYPAECVIVSSLAYELGDEKELLKEWRVVDLNRGFFACEEIEYYYLGEP